LRVLKTEPGWWYGPPGSLAARLLQPAAHIWGSVAARRIAKATPYASSLPVICVGNFTAGGTGKTPLSILIAKMLAARGERPAFLTRGYGGRIAGPHLLNLGLDTAADVGDEPLLLASLAPVMIARDRRAGAEAIERLSGIAPPTVIVMDDGLQNPALAKNLTIAVVDGRRGLGNGRVIPAGPLRAPLDLQLTLTGAIVVNRPRGVPSDEQHVVKALRHSFAGPVLEATVEPANAGPDLKGVRVMALAGIANPARFTGLLTELGAELVATKSFPDHHDFTENEAEALLAEAGRLDARIVTTQKDWVRLASATGYRAKLREHAGQLAIELRLEPRDAIRLEALLDAAIADHRKSRVKP
jgi:tetraacyldisaccharide 4'-kinase